MRSNRKIAANRGFTLIEVVISIAILAICSIFILQMFVMSSQLNRSARDIDYANSMLSTIIEGYVAEAYAPRETNTYYDEDWNECEPAVAQFMIAVKVNHREDGLSVPVSLEEDAAQACGALYEIECEVIRLNVQGTNAPIARTSSRVYFPIQEGAS